MKTYNKLFITIFFLGIISAIAINISLDIYKVFGFLDWNKTYVDANYRYMKIQYLTHPQDDFNAFIIGSSRSNFCNVKLASELSGYRYYTLSTSSEKVDRMLQKLVWLKKSGFSMKQIIIALDFDFMFLADDLPIDTLTTEEHPLLTGKSLFKFYFPYAFRFDSDNWGKYLKETFIQKKPINYKFVKETGHWYFPNNDDRIAQDHEKYMKEVFTNRMPYIRGKDDRLEVNIQRLRAIIQFLDENHIPRIVVINPYHHSSFKTFKMSEYSHWVKEVVKMSGEVWYFADLNSVTNNDYLFYESSHFRWEVGDMILRTIYSQQQTNDPKDFGLLLTASNIETYLQRFKT